MHNEILATRPDLMPVLYRGFPYHRRGEEAPTAPPITPYDVPVFSNRDGQVSVFMVREIVNAAYRELKREFTAEKSTSSTLFGPPRGACNSRPGPEPGDASFLYNYTVMHARSEFDDWDEPEKKRLMLRLWLDVERKPRSVVWEIHIYENAGGRSGIDPQPGRLPAVAKYRTPDEEVRGRVVAE